MQLKEKNLQILTRPHPQSGITRAWRLRGQKSWFEIGVGARLLAPDGSYVEFQLNEWQFYCKKCGECLKRKPYLRYFSKHGALPLRFCTRARCCPLEIELSWQHPLNTEWSEEERQATGKINATRTTVA